MVEENERLSVKENISGEILEEKEEFKIKLSKQIFVLK